MKSRESGWRWIELKEQRFFGGGDERCACPKRHGQNKMIKSEVFFLHITSLFPLRLYVTNE